MKNVGPALISVLLGIMLTSILAAVLIPVLDGALAGVAANMRSILAIVFVVVLIAMVYGFSVLLYDWLLKRKQQLKQKKQQAEDPNFSKQPVIAFAVLGLICLAIVAYQLLISTDKNTNISYLIGEKAVYGLIVWSIFNHFLGKHLNQHTQGLSFVVVLITMVASSHWTAERRALAEAASLARIEENVLSVLEGEEDENGRMAPIALDTGASTGELATMEASLNTYLNQVIANGNDYLTELEAIGYEMLLDGERIKNDIDLAESRFIVERAAAIVDKYEQLNEQTAFDFRDRFAEESISDVSRQSFRASFDEKLEPSLERARQIWELERQALAKVDEMVQFLAMSQSSWTMEGDQYVFETDKNLAIFNKIFDELDATTAKQDELRAISANNARNLFDGINN